MPTYYTRTDVQPGATLHYFDLQNGPHSRPGYTQRVTTIPETEFDHHSGGSVNRSNYRVLLSDATLAPLLVVLVGTQGAQGLAYVGDESSTPTELTDALASLADYAVLDDDDHSALENDLVDEAWERFGEDEFARSVVRVLDLIDPGHEHEIDDGVARAVSLRDVWREGCTAFTIDGGPGYAIEAGGGVHFYCEDWHLCCMSVLSGRRKVDYYAGWPELHTHLDILALATRVADE